MEGTIFASLSGLLIFIWEPSNPSPFDALLNVPYWTNFQGLEGGFPFPWFSYWSISYYEPDGLIPFYYLHPLRTIDSWSFNSLNFIEDALLYSTLAFLLSIYVDWKKKPKFACDLKFPENEFQKKENLRFERGKP